MTTHKKNIQPIEEVVEEFGKQDFLRDVTVSDSKTIVEIEKWLRTILQTRDQAWEARVGDAVDEIEKLKKTVYAAEEDYEKGQRIGFNDGLYKAQRVLSSLTPTSNTKKH